MGNLKGKDEEAQAWGDIATMGVKRGPRTRQEARIPGEAKTSEKSQVTGIIEGHVRTRMCVLCCVATV